jgi:predicted 2-oxoglutarate/Fe(II)-dependent dioxygenase YbiX
VGEEIMIINPMYWIFTSVLSPAMCELIIKEGKEQPSQIGEAGGQVNLNTRRSTVGWFPKNHWVEGIMLSHMNLANQQAWGFNVNSTEQVQFTNYGIDEFYDKHIDTFALEDNMRKLSAVIQLDPPENYCGGEFIFENTANGELFSPEDFRPQGSIIVFPSILPHMVSTVTDGHRHSAVCWASGPQFR